MGYEKTRFLSKVDDEFICAICTSIIENPVQTPCEHLFCNKCIKNWLNVNKTCPIDGRPLTANDLSDMNRILRNLLHKLDIKCDFEQNGCRTITKLEHLGQHVEKCVHNLDSEVVCDKGCNMTMPRREYLEHSCVSHLVKENRKLRHELSEQMCHFERTLDSQTKENRKLRHELSEQTCKFEGTLESQVSKLRHELSDQKCYFEQTLASQTKENRQLRHELSEQRRNFERSRDSKIAKLTHELSDQKYQFEQTLASQAEENRKLKHELSEQKRNFERSRESQITKLTHELSDQKCHFEQELDSQAKENKKLRNELSEQTRHFERTLDNQAKENRKLRNEISEQKCSFDQTLDSQVTKLRHELSEQKCNFEQELDSQAKENKKLSNEIDRQKKERLGIFNRQKKEIVGLFSNISLNELANWQQIHNVKIGPLNALEMENGRPSFLQSANALKPTMSSFEIRVTNSAICKYLYIGLTRRGCFSGLDLDHILSAFFNDNSSNFIYPVSFKNGDVIECGIEFPKNFINDEKHSYEICVSVNKKVVSKEPCVIPKDGFFPTIFFGSDSATIRYCQK